MNYSTYIQLFGIGTALTTLVGTTVQSTSLITLSETGTFLGLHPTEHMIVFLGSIIVLWFSFIVESYEEGDTGFPV